MRALVIIGLVLAVLLVWRVPEGSAVRPGDESCRMAQTYLMVGEDAMRYVWVCNTGLVSMANRLATKRETMDKSIRWHHATIHVTIGVAGRRVTLRHVWSSSSGIVMYANRQ